MFFRKRIFRRDIAPACAYCTRANPLDDTRMTCRKRGIVPQTGSCRAFRYDPLRRIPPKPAILRGTFSPADFNLEEHHEE